MFFEMGIGTIMKKICIIICCAIILLTLSSCTTYELVVPAGLWQSDDPQITLDITDEEIVYNGVYVRNGEEIDICIGFGNVSNRLFIHDAIILDENFEGYWEDYLYFSGPWEVKDDKLYLTLLPKWQEMYGIEEIVFTKIADYE